MNRIVFGENRSLTSTVLISVTFVLSDYESENKTAGINVQIRIDSVVLKRIARN